MSKGIYIIEDEEVVRLSMIKIIDKLLDHFEVIGYSGNDQEGLKECLELKIVEGQAVLRWNPVAAALAVNETSGFETYSLIPQAWWISGALSAVLLVIFGVQSWRLARPQ